MPPSRGPFSANIHPINPQTFCAYTSGHCAFWKWWGAPHLSKMHAYGVKKPLQITIRTPTGTTASYKPELNVNFPDVHFSANMHLIVPKLCCAYSSGHVLSENRYGFPDSKMYGYSVRITYEITLSTPAGTAETWFNAHLLRAHSPRIYIWSSPNFLCPYHWGHVLSECHLLGGPFRKWTGWGQKSTWKHP